MNRYTKKQLAEMSDLKFATSILQERLNGLTNPYSPLSDKLRHTIRRLEELDSEAVADTQVPGPFGSYEEAYDALDWIPHTVDEGGMELEKCSPAGEDFFFYIEGKDIPAEVAEYAEDFDPDEHAEMWVESRGKGGCPDSIRELIDDAQAIQEMLNELAAALATVPKKEEDDG